MLFLLYPFTSELYNHGFKVPFNIKKHSLFLFYLRVYPVLPFPSPSSQHIPPSHPLILFFFVSFHHIRIYLPTETISPIHSFPNPVDVGKKRRQHCLLFTHPELPLTLRIRFRTRMDLQVHMLQPFHFTDDRT